ncbi:hypothetical protein BY458DRAFT_586891 [Sporodiniella umbellata]|nr:hypothetical protein BY458DRAFT_586891 [Sporodiniella umbellata]
MENTVTKSEGTPPSVTSNVETATSHPPFHSLEQLHEAVLAAVNSHMPNFIANESQPMEEGSPRKQRTHQPLSELDSAKKESVRASNRERKKKWRIHNEERNKDNDLRCRVNKRASKLYGEAESVEKEKWAREEFEKRRMKRVEKERRKHIVNNVLSVPIQSGSPNEANHQMPAYYSPLPQIDNAAASKLLDFPADLQRQLLEQLNHSMLALTNGIQNNNNTNPTENIEEESIDNPEATEPEVPIKPEESGPVENKIENSSMSENDKDTLAEVDETEDNAQQESSTTQEKKPEYPMDAVLSLMQLNAAWRQ